MNPEVSSESVPENAGPRTAAITEDIASAIVQVIDVCTKRGAFEGSELLPVGTLRNKIVSLFPKETK